MDKKVILSLYENNHYITLSKKKMLLFKYIFFFLSQHFSFCFYSKVKDVFFVLMASYLHKKFQRNCMNFYKQRFFSTQPLCCLTLSWIELIMLLRCCLIHITIIILTHILYLVYLCQCLGLGQFMLYHCHLFFIFSFIFIVIIHMTLLKQTYLFFVHGLECFLL